MSLSSEAYTSAGGISALFSANLRGAGISESFEGTLQLRGDKFVLKTPDMHVWYDGETQWTYLARTNEVNISSPESSELSSINPMIFLRTYKKGYSLSYKGESTGSDGRMSDDIELTSLDLSSDIAKIELQISRVRHLPERMVIEQRNGVRTVIRIHSLQTGVTLPDGIFGFPSDEYEDVTEVDLR
jgi:outer membrane lipoprotein-sorting protein